MCSSVTKLIISAKLQPFTGYLLICLTWRSHHCAVLHFLPFWQSKRIRPCDRLEEYGSGTGALVASHLYWFCARLTWNCKGSATASEQQQWWRRDAGRERWWSFACLKCATLAVRNSCDNKNIPQTIRVSCQMGCLGAVLWLFTVTEFAVLQWHSHYFLAKCWDLGQLPNSVFQVSSEW